MTILQRLLKVEKILNEINCREQAQNQPPITKHNELEGLQGGVEGEYFHLTEEEYNNLGEYEEPKTTEFLVTKGAGSFDNGETFPGGKTLAEAFELLLTDIYNPTFVNPSTKVTLNIPTVNEVGQIIPSFIITNTFDRGLIKGGYTGLIWDTNKSMGSASGLPINHVIDGVTTTTTNLIQTKITPNYIIPLGGTSFNGRVNYSEGTKPLNSKGEQLPALPTGFVTNSTTIQGVYPYFYGVLGVNETINDINLSLLTKVVKDSVGTISIPYSGVIGKKLVIIVPTTSTFKSRWFIDALNNNLSSSIIGSPDNLFPTIENRTYNSPTNGLWSNIGFRVYISSVTNINETIQLQN